MSSKRMWVVRAGEDAYLVDEFKDKNLIAIGWNELGDLTSIKNSSEVKELIKKTYPTYSTGKVNITASQINRFRSEFQIDDYVVTYNPTTRNYLLGKIEGNYEWDKKNLTDYKNIRKVRWIGEIPRDKLSVSTKNTLGAISTIFEVAGSAMNELLAPLNEVAREVLEDKGREEIELLKKDIENQAHEFIKDKVVKLDWENMQELVAGILRAMGYKTIVSPRGPDMGKDIVASPDGLGLEEPRIVVEVKHRVDQPMSNHQIKSFIGGLRKQKGLYVSTGSFTKDARHEAERAEVPITLIDLDMLVDLIIDNYDKFDVETRGLLPLTKIYWPK